MHLADKARIEHLVEVDSTNEEARRRVTSGERGPLWIYADRQTKGRGSRGRSWSSYSGNLLTTGLFTLQTTPGEAAQLSYAAALAVSDLLNAVCDPSQVKVKWPNDILLDQQKVSGILLESGSIEPGLLWLAVGIGLNLKTYPDSTDFPATSLAWHGIELTSHDAILKLAERFDIWLTRWKTHGFLPLKDAWINRAYGLGESCRIQVGQEMLTGVFSDLMPDGTLRLDLADGQRRYISAGDIFFPNIAR